MRRLVELTSDGATPWMLLHGPTTAAIVDIAGGSAQLQLKGKDDADSELAPFGAAKTANEAFTIGVQKHEKFVVRFSVTGMSGTFRAYI